MTAPLAPTLLRVVDEGSFAAAARALNMAPAGVTRLGDVERENARLRSEITALRQALRASASAGRDHGPPPRGTPMPGSAVPSTGFRGGHASVGRYAGLRTAT